MEISSKSTVLANSRKEQGITSIKSKQQDISETRLQALANWYVHTKRHTLTTEITLFTPLSVGHHICVDKSELDGSVSHRPPSFSRDIVLQVPMLGGVARVARAPR